jgi:hypothetical protein
MTWTSGVGVTRVTSQATGAARAPASDTSNGTITGMFLRRVSHRIAVVTP